MKKELREITLDKFDNAEFECECGNNSFDDGFYPCDENGEEMEPTIGSGWDKTYVCATCGLIWKVR